MVTIDRMTERELPRYSKVFQAVYDITNDFEGVYYKFFTDDGKELVVHELNNGFLVFEMDGNLYRILGEFIVDDNGRMISINDKTYKFYFDNGAMIQEDIDTKNTELLDLNKRTNGEDYDGYNGIVHYNQYNPELDIKVAITFQQMCYQEHATIYPYHIEKPFLISITERACLDKAFRKQIIYMREDFSVDDLGYNISAIRDYGLIEFLEKGSYLLYGEREISRYTHIVHFGGSDYVSPFSKRYTLEEMTEKLSELGFNSSVPKRLLNFYNKSDELYLLFSDINAEINKAKENQRNQSLNLGGKE